MFLRLTVFIFLFFNCAFIQAQQHFALNIESINSASLLSSISYKTSFSSATERNKELQKVLFNCYDNAYLTADYDSIVNDSLQLKAYLNFGKQYKWASVKKGNVDDGVLSEIGFREKIYNNRPVFFKDVTRLEEKLIVYYENNGFPFASVMLDSIVISDSTIAAQLKLTKNKEVKIDSIIIKGNVKITPTFMHSYLGIKPGSLYDESKLKKINSRISELQFVRSKAPSRIVFTDKYSKLILNLDGKKASQFDGIIGFLPNSQTGKTTITGTVHLMLQNGLLGRGELIDVNWQRLQAQTQDLKVHLVYPFLLNTPFGVDYNFEIYKRDTTFDYVNNNIGLQYLLTGGNYLKLFYNNKVSSLLSTSGLESITTLPTYADVTTNMYGLGLKYEKLDYRFNPRKGYSVTSNVSVGTKTIHKNANVNPVVYNNLNLTTTQYNADFDGSVFIPFKKRSTFKLGMKSAIIQGPTIFQNELYRIGGLNTLRGFNEQSIFASAYSILTVEYRLLLEQNSYLFLFADGAYYENHSTSEHISDTPFGFGPGISFETKAGIFSMTYALGKQFNNPIEFGSGKIHFGIVNYF
jgi:outer membrane protein assembly factor BamA